MIASRVKKDFGKRERRTLHPWEEFLRRGRPPSLDKLGLQPPGGLPASALKPGWASDFPRPICPWKWDFHGPSCLWKVLGFSGSGWPKVSLGILSVWEFKGLGLCHSGEPGCGMSCWGLRLMAPFKYGEKCLGSLRKSPSSGPHCESWTDVTYGG